MNSRVSPLICGQLRLNRCYREMVIKDRGKIGCRVRLRRPAQSRVDVDSWDPELP